MYVVCVCYTILIGVVMGQHAEQFQRDDSYYVEMFCGVERELFHAEEGKKWDDIITTLMCLIVFIICQNQGYISILYFFAVFGKLLYR